MDSADRVILILLLVFFVGVPLVMLIALLICHFERKLESHFGRYDGCIEETNEESNSQVRESVSLSLSPGYHQTRALIAPEMSGASYSNHPPLPPPPPLPPRLHHRTTSGASSDDSGNESDYWPSPLRGEIEPPRMPSFLTQGVGDRPPFSREGLDQQTIDSLPIAPVGRSLSENMDCSICLNKYSQDSMLRRLPCTHAFHVMCIDGWLKIKSECPLCKKNLRELLHDQTSADRSTAPLLSASSSNLQTPGASSIPPQMFASSSNQQTLAARPIDSSNRRQIPSVPGTNSPDHEIEYWFSPVHDLYNVPSRSSFSREGLDQRRIDSLPTAPVGESILERNSELHCSICLNKYSKDDIVRRLPCTHAFHVVCIDGWLRIKSECPLCKENPRELLDE